MKTLLWASFDEDGDGAVSTIELIGKLSLCERGNVEDLARFFFDLYDADNDGSVNQEELIATFTQLVAVSSGVATKTLSSAQKMHLVHFFMEADAGGDSALQFDEFLAAVKRMELPDAKHQFCTPNNMWLVFITGFFEMGAPLPGLSSVSSSIVESMWTRRCVDTQN